MSNLNTVNSKVLKGLVSKAVAEFKEDFKLFKLYNRIVDAKKTGKYKALFTLVKMLEIDQKSFTIDELKEILGEKMLKTAKGKDVIYFNFEKILNRMVEYYLQSLETDQEKAERLNAESLAIAKKKEKALQAKKDRDEFKKFKEDKEQFLNTLSELKKQIAEQTAKSNKLRSDLAKLHKEHKKVAVVPVNGKKRKMAVAN